MYKIDDITKLDLSDKKQYAIAKETLDRYELTQSEKKGLLEGIKNIGGGDVGEDGAEYRYFLTTKFDDSDYFLDLTNLGCEARSIIFTDAEGIGYNAITDKKCNVYNAFPMFAFKVNLNLYCYGPNGHVLTKDIVDEFLENVKSENDSIVEITKEEYEQKSETIKYAFAAVDLEQPQKQITFFYDIIKKAYDKYNLENFYQHGLYYTVWTSTEDFYVISKINNLVNKGFVLSGYYKGNIDNDSPCVYVDNEDIRILG